jgi:hypothetical protein
MNKKGIEIKKKSYIDKSLMLFSALSCFLLSRVEVKFLFQILLLFLIVTWIILELEHNSVL